MSKYTWVPVDSTELGGRLGKTMMAAEGKVKPFVMEDVREAARETERAALRNGGWWTLGRVPGGFVRMARGRHGSPLLAFEPVPLVHVKVDFDSVGKVFTTLERAYYSEKDARW